MISCLLLSTVHQAERDGPLVESEEDIMSAQICEHALLCATGVSQDISSRMVTGRSLCNAQHTMQGPQMICFLSDILKSIPCGPNREKFVENYRHVRKLGGEDVNESQKYWEIIWAEQNEDPLTQSACFFSGMLSAPGNLDYVLETWRKLSENLNRSHYAVFGSMFALYLIAWTIQNWVEKNGSDPEHVDYIPLAYHKSRRIPRTKKGAMKLVKHCIKETKGVVDFVLKPYFDITMLRWKFEIKCDSGTLNETGASCLLKGVDETFQKCWSLKQDWMKADAFGAMVSAVNLKIEIALYFKGRGQNDKFHSIKREAMHFLNCLNEYFENNQSLITIYDCAWLFSVRSKCFRVDDNETDAQLCAEHSACNYLKCSRYWRAVEEAEFSGNRKLIKHCKRECLQSELSGIMPTNTNVL